ncbi:MAG: hypothetical protein CL578_05445 [Alteromonadaceae bacterium]|uniref:NACHT domain-containing protein n=1 Tax=uncultured Paraglaciecola sp. TaxID=1765024 RepID=UPI000C684138|nr:hypothetical protein [Alteromonadaceae bacterium]|tara:strand:+ start:4498 stop:6906 length:2409 start_codon:yes stop_codon:yes gene_type:complete
MNSVDKGDKLRDKVYLLCVAAGKQNTGKECNIAGKNVDVYFEDNIGFEGKKRYVVECKNYTNLLTQDMFSKIYNDYHSRKSSFDRLIVISEKGVNDSFARGVKENKDWLSHFTWQEFLFELINFKNYFQSLSYLTKDDALNQYYIPPQDTDGNSIEIQVEKWIEGENNQPLAFLAGYGMGKSSLAKHLASTFSSKFMNGSFSRIPVYIKLGDLYNQQDIKALIINYFASEHQIGGMSPTLFKQMNRLGLLLLIFDGFDEMKHGMTERDFIRIFTEIKTLVDGDSRLMVLGRPSALTSDSDRAVLFGSKAPSSIINGIRDGITFTEVTIALFDDTQLEKFVTHYLDILNIKRKDNGKKKLGPEIISGRAQEVLSKEFRDLIRRPVHAEMLCKIAVTYPDQTLTQKSRYQLYESFILMFLDRESSKQAREAIDIDARLLFMKEVAWYFWPDKGHQGFTIAQVQSSGISVPERQRPMDDIYREMLIGSLMELKDQNLYFFAHRSFQEYLVAEHIINTPRFNRIIEKLNAKISNEIVNFIEESGYLDDVVVKIFDALPDLHSPMRIDLTLIFKRIDTKAFSKHIRTQSGTPLSTKQYFIFSIIEYDAHKGILDYSTIPSASLKASALCGFYFEGASNSRESFGLEMRNIVGLTLMLIKPLVDKADIGKHKVRSQVLLRDKDEIIAALAIKHLSVKYNANNEFESLEFDGDGLFNEINKQLSLLEMYEAHRKDLASFSAIDGLIETGYKSIGDEIRSNDRRHIEYRRNIIKFFRSDVQSLFVIEKTTKQPINPKISKNPILTLKGLK